MKTQVPNTYQKKKGSKFSWKEGRLESLSFSEPQVPGPQNGYYDAYLVGFFVRTKLITVKFLLSNDIRNLQSVI